MEAKAVRRPKRIGDFVQTFTGRKFWPLDPRPEEIFIEDVAHALSLICRFNGHCRTLYVVGDHSIRASYIEPDKFPLWKLIHDSPEACGISDLSRPVKHHSELGRHYCTVEKRIMDCFCIRFGLQLEEPEEVKAADNIMVLTERRDLMRPTNHKWNIPGTLLPERIIPRTPQQAENDFLARFYELGGHYAA